VQRSHGGNTGKVTFLPVDLEDCLGGDHLLGQDALFREGNLHGRDKRGRDLQELLVLGAVRYLVQPAWALNTSLKWWAF
jgi:hypothetical protein